LDSLVIVGLLSLTGSAIGTLGGILTSNKLTNYRIQELEKKVDKHNRLIERMVAVESSAKQAHHRIDELREELVKA
jgi:hypothetical protein